MTPQRQMVYLAVVAVAVMAVLAASSLFSRRGAAPAPSPAASVNRSASDDQEEQQAEPDSTPTSDVQQFHGHDCVSDCSQMRDGYSYAVDHNVTNGNDCANANNSDEFAEGCRIYVNDNAGPSP